MKKTIDTTLKHQWWNGISGIISLGSVIGVLIGAIIHFNKDINQDQLLKQISILENVYAKFNEKRAREDIEVLLDDTKNKSLYLER